MDQVIMPELITSEFADAIAKNPEVLKMILDHQPGEEVIVGQNCTIGCSSNPTNLKLVFCNVTIGLDDLESRYDKECDTEEIKERIGNCNIKICGRDIDKKGRYWVELSNELYQLTLEVAVLQAKLNVTERILRLIPRHTCNRKLVARCKIDFNQTSEILTVKKKELEYKTWLMHSGK